MKVKKFDPKKAFQVTKTIYYSLIAGSLAYLAVVIYIKTEKYFFKVDFSDPLIVSLTILTIASIPAGYIISKNSLKHLNSADPLSKKFQLYQSALIIRLAACEGVGLFAIVCLLLTNNAYCLLFYSGVLLVMLSYYPVPEKMGKEISLSQSEIDSFAG